MTHLTSHPTQGIWLHFRCCATIVTALLREASFPQMRYIGTSNVRRRFSEYYKLVRIGLTLMFGYWLCHLCYHCEGPRNVQGIYFHIVPDPIWNFFPRRTRFSGLCFAATNCGRVLTDEPEHNCGSDFVPDNSLVVAGGTPGVVKCDGWTGV